MKRLLSIAIATKNRERYCIAAIESILNFKDERLEITVADNSSSKKVKDFIESLNSSQVKYIYDDSDISSIDNFNKAIELTTGEYVMLIGDDDSILPNAIEIADWAKKNDVDSISSENIYTYFWPGSNPVFPQGMLRIPEFSDKKNEIDAKKELVKLLKNGIVNYMFFKLPKSYHGIVKKEILCQIKKITGNYYGALSPDIFSVISISLLVKKHYSTTVPFSIAGVCTSSTTSDQIMGKHCGLLQEMPHLKNRKVSYQWDENIPKVYSVTTTWGDSGLNALRAMNEQKYLEYFNVYPLIAQTLLMNRKHILKLVISESNKMRKNQKISFLFFWTNVILASANLIMEKVLRVFKQKFSKKNVEVVGVYDIEEALKIIRK